MKRVFAAHLGLLAMFVTLMPAPILAKENKKKDPDAIGDRDVDKGVNFYSLEKEIALGKQVAQELERQARIIDDPIISEYVNPVGQNLVRNSDVKVTVTIKALHNEDLKAMASPCR